MQNEEDESIWCGANITHTIQLICVDWRKTCISNIRSFCVEFYPRCCCCCAAVMSVNSILSNCVCVCAHIKLILLSPFFISFASGFFPILCMVKLRPLCTRTSLLNETDGRNQNGENHQFKQRWFLGCCLFFVASCACEHAKLLPNAKRKLAIDSADVRTFSQ